MPHKILRTLVQQILEIPSPWAMTGIAATSEVAHFPSMYVALALSHSLVAVYYLSDARWRDVDSLSQNLSHL